MSDISGGHKWSKFKAKVPGTRLEFSMEGFFDPKKEVEPAKEAGFTEIVRCEECS